MATLTYTITATEAEFEGFADRIGYMPEVLSGEMFISNPESRLQYITRLLKEKQDQLFFTPYVTEVDQIIRDQKEAEKEALRANIRSRSTINYVA